MGEETVKTTFVIRFLGGNLQTGFPAVECRIYKGKREIQHRQIIGKLPENPELYKSLQNFLSYERELTRSSRHTMPREVQNNPDPNLTKNFNEWLENKDFEGIREFFLYCARDCQRISIESTQLEIQQLPWHRWTLIQRYCPDVVVSHKL